MTLIVGIDIGWYTIKACYYNPLTKSIDTINFINKAECLMNFKWRQGLVLTNDNFSIKNIITPKEVMGKTLDQIQEKEIFDVKVDTENKQFNFFIKKDRTTYHFIGLTEVIGQCLKEVYCLLEQSNIPIDSQSIFVVSIPHEANEIYKEQMTKIIEYFKEEKKVQNVFIKDEMQAAALSNPLDESDDSDKLIMVIDYAKQKVNVCLIQVTKTEEKIIGFKRSETISGKSIDDKIIKRVKEKVKNDFQLKEYKDKLEKKSIIWKLENRLYPYTFIKGYLTIPLTGIICTSTEANNLLSTTFEISEEEFDEMIKDDIKQIQQMIQELCQSCNIDKSKINNVLCIGGYSHLKSFKSMINQLFEMSQLELNNSFDNKHAIAYGLIMTQLKHMKKILTNVPFSIGIEGIFGNIIFLVEKGDDLPHQKKLIVNVRERKTIIPLYFGEFVVVNESKKVNDLILELPSKIKLPATIQLYCYLYKDGQLKIEWNQSQEEAKKTILDISLLSINEEKLSNEEETLCIKRNEIRVKLKLKQIYDEMKNTIECSEVKEKYDPLPIFDFNAKIKEIENVLIKIWEIFCKVCVNKEKINHIKNEMKSYNIIMKKEE
ncbi:hypothetical protein ENUP19_0257G0072 [Entamoeba nuttalli]|uniref:Heat shock protein 70 n=2 Tax=Entamoeba nuttalli TaxID=412467 RepID=K2GBW1_ENTNP|nr:hypothetical protein ENU1_104210 [Entamoeba nuttalli P19]EKE40046.1 hypothetical protein ENU1_104210 [Entamoeba nuttalli P19]|eukprot:XP_008857619.1 hypothetical protein ENU1_104210 [Entamoeba nuttalli P19]